MTKHFAQLFWGLLLVILDFSINGFDLLMDGVGYLIVAAGCLGLASLSPRFMTARTLCFVLTALWLVGLFLPSDFSARVLYGFISAGVNCAMIWQLLGGLGEFAMAQQRPDLQEKAYHRRLAYIIIQILITFLAFVLQGTSGGAAFVLVLGLGMLVLTVMILHLIHRFKVELATY